MGSSWAEDASADLESAAHAEDAVVGLLGRETLEGEKNNIGLFGNEIVGSVGVQSGQRNVRTVRTFLNGNSGGAKREENA